MARVDAVIRKTTVENFGPVRSVKPTLVFELGFEGIARSTRHKSGIAVRFPRMLRWREDKPVEEADTLETLAALLPAAAAAGARALTRRACAPEPIAARPRRWQARRGPRRMVRRARLEAVRVPARGVEGDRARAESGLLHATTGAGKTYAVWLGALQAFGASPKRRRASATREGRAAAHRAVDHADARARRRHAARAAAAAGSARAATVERRRAQRRHRRPAERARRTARLPTVLVTTPESLSLLLVARRCARGARHGAAWSSSTNGTSCWATSAACRCSWRWRACGAGTRRSACGACRPRWATWTRRCARCSATTTACWCRAQVPKKLVIDSLLPGRAERFPWGGHLGLRDAAAGDRGDRRQQHHAGLHQHALAGGDLVPGDARGAARLGRADRAAPRLARPRGARVGRGWA